MEELRTSQLWKLNEIAAKKQGVRRSIYEIKRKSSINEDDDINPSETQKEWEIGKTYTGEWHNDLRDGYGVQIWSNLCKYEGDWKHDQRNGHGIYWIPIWSSKHQQLQQENKNKNQDDITSIYTKSPIELSSYISNNVSNLLQIRDQLYKKRTNKDKISYQLHKQYEGEWMDDMKHGKGTFYYKNGNKYSGQFSNNLRNGYGIMYYSNGDKYEGDWKFNKKNGFGIYINNKENNIYIGYWMNNKKEGPGYYKYKENGKLYIAEWINNTPNCGYFVNINDIDVDIDIDDFEKVKKIFPELGLINADSILCQQIKQIRSNRKLIRHLTIIDDIDELFETENDELKHKIIDIFQQISVSKYNDKQQCYVNKENLFDAIKDFKVSQVFHSNQQIQIEKLNLFIAKYCNDLGIEKSEEKSDKHNTIFIMTLLDFAKILVLLIQCQE